MAANFQQHFYRLADCAGVAVFREVDGENIEPRFS